MKKVLGVLMILLGVGLGLYIGVWVMFVGGIAGMVEIIQSNNFESMEIAKNVAKVVFAGAVGGIVAQLLIIPGYVLLNGEF